MSHPRRFRFGAQLHQPLPGLTWAESVRRVEELGYSTLFVPDHFGEQLAPITAMATAAAFTERLSVGSLVFDNDYRHPVVLAKEMASIDAVFQGRVEVGIGAGWMASDYRESGIPMDPPKVRVDRLIEAVESARRGEATHMLCYLDLDRFKIVNDTSGHLAGDALLREVAKLLREAVRDSDTVARLGGDEFGMLLVGCPLEKARQIADDVCRSVANYRFVWQDRVFNVGVSIGLIEIGREAGTVEQLLAAADSACYVAKKEGAGRVSVYSARDEALARSSGEIQWLQKLQAALKEERFTLYYQPIVAAYGNDVDGPSMEVLLRMLDDNGQEIPPGEFVSAAERYRLMASVDRWVVQTTLVALSRNAFQLARDRSVAMNISAQTLADPLFLEFVVETLDQTGVSPDQVCFEIAESAVVGNIEQARRFVGVLHGMGCKFTIDDFGSGVGSFSSLKSLPLDYLKLDGSFMRNLARDSVNQTMVTAMIKLARTLNFKIIAEQVEDSAALDAARKMGVDYVQGFVIARPERLGVAA